MLRKIFALITSVIIISSALVLPFTVSADEKCTITVEQTTAATGDIVYVDLNIANNPGIMAVTISITYNPAALEFIDYYYGDVFTDYTVAAHPDRKHIRLVISERSDKTADGTVASFKFKVADNAEAELHKISVDYSSGDFCNSELVRIMPVIVSGGVEVEYNGSNCSHKAYGEWTTEVSATCLKPGVEQRVCKTCAHTEHRETEKLGHEYSNSWTVDTPATADSPGTMSRHCIRCDATKDTTTFTVEQSDKGEIDNKVDSVVPDNEVVKDIIVTQNPNIDYENANDNKPDDNDSQGGDSDNDNSSDNTNNNNTDSTIGSESEKPTSTENTDKADDDLTEQIEKILNILYPNDEENAENAEKIAEKLLEAFPNFNSIFGFIKILLIALFAIILI